MCAFTNFMYFLEFSVIFIIIVSFHFTKDFVFARGLSFSFVVFRIGLQNEIVFQV